MDMAALVRFDVVGLDRHLASADVCGRAGWPGLALRALAHLVVVAARLAVAGLSHIAGLGAIVSRTPGTRQHRNFSYLAGRCRQTAVVHSTASPGLIGMTLVAPLPNALMYSSGVPLSCGMVP
jgi:hypothetical protein